MLSLFVILFDKKNGDDLIDINDLVFVLWLLLKLVY